MQVTLREVHRTVGRGIWNYEPADITTETSCEHFPIYGWKAELLLKFARLLAPESFHR